MATPSSIPAWRIPWTEEPVRPQSIGSHRVRHDWSDLACTHGAFEILSVPFKRKVSIYPLSFWTPEIKTRWSSNQTLRATLPLQDPWAGSPKCDSKLSLLKNPCNIIILQFVDLPPGDTRLDSISWVCLFQCLLVLPYVFNSFLAGANLFHWWCSEDSCDFGEFIREGEVRVFLFHYLGQTLELFLTPILLSYSTSSTGKSC